MILSRQQGERVSLVVLAYNEAACLGACLDAIAKQTVMPYEVIVVDNNSTDSTAAIARSYPFVRLVQEHRQGKAYAREAGFRTARGDILGRIDADSRVHPNWTETVQQYMASHPKVAAVTGKCYFYDFPLQRVASAAHAVVYHCLQRMLTGNEVLWGTNMAVRRTAWQQVAHAVSVSEAVDEDIDLTFLLHKKGLRIARYTRMRSDVSVLRGNVAPRDIGQYLQTWPQDYLLHNMPVRAGIIRCLIVGIRVVTYVPGVILSRHRRAG